MRMVRLLGAQLTGCSMRESRWDSRSAGMRRPIWLPAEPSFSVIGGSLDRTFCLLAAEVPPKLPNSRVEAPVA